jgi:hypothetical protein
VNAHGFEPCRDRIDGITGSDAVEVDFDGCVFAQLVTD